MNDDAYTEWQTARRRDEVIRRTANTPAAAESYSSSKKEKESCLGSRGS